MDRVFSSWKEIATYLGKGVRTVQRWEAVLKLPVHRPSKQGIVLAYESELQQWARRTGERLNGGCGDGNGNGTQNDAKERCAETRDRSSELCRIAGERIRDLQSTVARARELSQAIGTPMRSPVRELQEALEMSQEELRRTERDLERRDAGNGKHERSKGVPNAA